MTRIAPLLGYGLAAFFFGAAAVALCNGYVYLMIPYLILAVGVGSAAYDAGRLE